MYVRRYLYLCYPLLRWTMDGWTRGVERKTRKRLGLRDFLDQVNKNRAN
jgi:hypothetical protein